MENASKALIIAGAILIAILLISVGILVMHAVNEPLDETKNASASQAAQMFNSKFTNYAGQNKTAQEVTALCSDIIASNSTDKNHQIIIRANINNARAWYTANGFMSIINNNTKYTINLVYASILAKGKNGFQLTNLTDGFEVQWEGYGDIPSHVTDVMPDYKTEVGYVCAIEIKNQ